MKPKVINLFTRLGAGGPPVQAVHLLRELPRCGFQSILAAGQCGPGEDDMLYLLNRSEQVRSIPYLARAVSPLDDLRALIHLYRFFRQERPDIVHTHTAKAGVLGRLAARAAGVPRVVHTFHGNVLSGYFSPPVNSIIRLIERALSLVTDRICVLSPQQKQDLVQSHRIATDSKIIVLPLGLDLADFHALKTAPRSGQLCIGWLGRLVAVKNISLLCAVVRHAVERLPNVRFLIAGDGPERHLVTDLARCLGRDRCEFLGWQQDIVPVVERCHLLMQTSRNEGTPVALIQGLAAGRPFVSTPAGGVVDMAIGDRSRDQSGSLWCSNAVLVAPQPERFTEVFEELTKRPALLGSMCESAREAARHYSLDTFLNRLQGLYLDLLSKPRSDQQTRAVGEAANDLHPVGRTIP